MQNENNFLPVNATEDIKNMGELISQCKTQGELISKIQELEQAETHTKHTFGNGLYIRELRVKAGVFLIGHKHKYDQLNLFISGKVAIFTEDGVKILTAPMYFMGRPGRKIGYIIEDMVWVNIHSTLKTDVTEIEKEILDFSDVPEAPPNINLDKIADVASYHEVIDRLGFTHEQVRAMSEIDNVTSLPNGSYSFKVAPSDIEGKGIFATEDIIQDEIIGPMRLANNRTILGRYTNHAKEPNAKVIVIGTNLYLKAIKPIKGCKGVKNGDEITVCYHQAFTTSMETLK